MGKETAEEIEQWIQESIRTLGEKKNDKYLGMLEADTIKQEEIKGKLKEYFRRTRNLFEDKLGGRILIKRINPCAVSSCKITRDHP